MLVPLPFIGRKKTRYDRGRQVGWLAYLELIFETVLVIYARDHGQNRGQLTGRPFFGSPPCPGVPPKPCHWRIKGAKRPHASMAAFRALNAPISAAFAREEMTQKNKEKRKTRRKTRITINSNSNSNKKY